MSKKKGYLIVLVLSLLILTPISYSLDFFDISLGEGWNFVSIPLDPLDTDISSVLSSIEGNYSKVVYYNGSNYIYDPNDLTHSNLLYLNYTMGFWINMNTADTLEINGYYPETGIIHLDQGWNMIGFPSIENKTADQLGLEVIYRYDGSYQSYINGRNTTLNSLDILEKGYGYWVKSASETDIIFNNNIANNPIVIDSITINDNQDVIPNANGNKVVNISVLVSDEDGTIDIVSVKADTPRGILSLSQKTIIDADTAEYYGTFEMYYYDPADAYTIDVNASDSESSDIKQKSFNYIELKAIELDTNSINFPGVNPEQSAYFNGDLNMGTGNPTVKNVGNVIIDVDISGTDLTGPGTITVANVEYQFGSAGFNVLSNIASTYDLNLGLNTMTNVDFKLTVPASTLSGSYSGTFTISAK
ncbi:MAG: hypothetical protein ABIJ08_03235 [Nanoarchaeota archaeon]